MTSAILALALALAPHHTEYPRLLDRPAVYGDEVAFQYSGNIWITDSKTGASRQLTQGIGAQAQPHFSPDGKQVAFVAAYDGAPEIYTIDITGANLHRVTYGSGVYALQEWTPEGKLAFTEAAFNNVPETGLPQFRLDTVSSEGGIPTRTALDEVALVSYFKNGHEIVYNRIPNFVQNWRGYRGGTQAYLSLYNFATNKYSEIPHGKDQSMWPMAVGQTIYYAGDKGTGTLNLWKYSLDDKKATQLTHFADEDVRWPSTDGKSIVFTQDGYLWEYTIATGTLAKLDPQIDSANLLERPRMVNSGDAVQSIAVSPSGVRVAVEARGDIYSVPASTGETRNLTDTDGPREQDPAWSPDGQTIAYLSDASGSLQIYTKPQLGGPPNILTEINQVITNFAWSPDSAKIAFATAQGGLFVLDAKTKKVVQMHQSAYGLGPFSWAPDSHWIAFTDGAANGNGILFIGDADSGQSTQITHGTFNDSDAVFDKSGKYLYLLSNRTFNPGYGEFEFSLKVTNGQRLYVLTLKKDEKDPLIPKDEEEPVKPSGPPPAEKPHPKVMPIDFDGLNKRIVPLPLPPGTFPFLQGSEHGLLFMEGPNLFKYTLGTPAPEPLFLGLAGNFDINPDQTKLAYAAGPVVGVASIAGGPPAHIGDGAVNTSGVERVIDPKKEWTEIFNESTRFIANTFYDKDWIASNWQRISDHYRSYLPDVHSRYELNTIIAGLLSELRTSHSFLEAPGDLGPLPEAVPVGFLGADYQAADGHIEFKKVYPGESYDPTATGPLGVPGVDVHDGDFLLSIDGHPLDGHSNPSEFLLGKVGKVVTITVNSKPTETGARTYQVRPIGSEVRLRYVDFLNKEAELVNRLSDGKVGYFHMENTAEPGAIDFIKGFYHQTDKKALIVDERWNGGGYFATWAVDRLARSIHASIEVRNSKDILGGILPALQGPKALLINGYAGSGGDFFPWYFRLMHVGPLIGTRTWGGLVGIGAPADLVDGGSFTCPGAAIYDPATSQIIAENHGVTPDITVDRNPSLVVDGHDPALEAAVQYLLDQLKKNPVAPFPTDVTPHPVPQSHD